MFRYMLNGMFASRVLRAPAGDGTDGGGGGTEDRGDNFESNDEPPPADADGHKKEGDDTGDKGTGLADKLAAEEEERERAEKEKKEKKTGKPSLKEGKGEEVDEDEDEDDPAQKDEKKRTRMPLSRHKAILEAERAERKAVEQRLAKYEQGDRITVINGEITKAENDIATLDKTYAQQIADGDHKAAAETSREIRALERSLSDKKVSLATQAAESRAYEKVRYDTVVERLEEAYAELNPDHDDYDKETTQDVLDLATTYRRNGLTPGEAIQKAAKKLLGAETKKQTTAVDTKPRVSEEDVAEAKRKERRAAQVAKNLDVSKKQPADTGKLGTDSDKAGGGIRASDVFKMTDTDFNSLDEATLARMRGDVLA